MEDTGGIVRYLKEKYQPETILVYGSFADGSNNRNSDFDALVITEQGRGHDASAVAGVILDVFLYPPEHFAGDFDVEEVVQCFDGKLLLDKNGLGERLLARVREYLAAYRPKERQLVEQDLDWCQKMLGRCVRGDAEGFYRWHWLLKDSLEIYCDVRGRYFFGPKKALRAMAQEDSESFSLYSAALEKMDGAALRAWVGRLGHILGK